MKALLAVMLVGAYGFALIMSAGHLAKWYALTLGDLPSWFAVGLAGALEGAAFLMSLLSNSLLKGSRWASSGAVVALALVWMGNYLSMLRVGREAGVSPWEVFLMSLFVPVSTYWLAKVLGELLYRERNAERARSSFPERGEAEEREPEKVQAREEEEGEKEEERKQEEEERKQEEEENPFAEKRAAFWALLKAGVSIPEAGKRVGVATSTAYRWAKEMERARAAAGPRLQPIPQEVNEEEGRAAVRSR